MDFASVNGWFDVLQWWKKSGLQLKYTWRATNADPGAGDRWKQMNPFGGVVNAETLHWWKTSGLEIKTGVEKDHYFVGGRFWDLGPNQGYAYGFPHMDRLRRSP